MHAFNCMAVLLGNLIEIASYFFCTLKIDHFQVTQACKMEYLNQMDSKIWLVFFIKVLFKFANHHHTIYCTLPMEQLIVATLKARLRPYTWCAPLKSLWDIE